MVFGSGKVVYVRRGHKAGPAKLRAAKELRAAPCCSAASTRPLFQPPGASKNLHFCRDISTCKRGEIKRPVAVAVNSDDGVHAIATVCFHVRTLDNSFRCAD